MVKWEPIVDSSIWQWLDVTLSPNNPHVLFSSTLEKLWPGHLLAISGPLETSSKFDKKKLLWFCLWFVFPDNSTAFGWTSQCVCQVNLISLVCKLSKKTESKINPFYFCRLESELLSVASVFTNFLECVQRLRDSAVNTQSNGENNVREMRLL